MDRDYPYDDFALCDICGKVGAFDIMSDYLCEECIEDREGWSGNFNEDDWREGR